MSTLKWARNNSKLNELASHLGLKKSEVVGFDLPAGFTCPAASLCLAYANKQTGKIKRGKDAQFLCYAAKLEAAFPAVRRAHWTNFDALRPIMNDELAIAGLIMAELPKGIKVVRIHTSGDFFTDAYYRAWKIVAMHNPDVKFFAYTKVYKLVSDNLRPDNFKMVYSHGGKYDGLADYVPTCFVTKDAQEAEDLGLPVACPTSTCPDDFEYIMAGRSFAILLH